MTKPKIYDLICIWPDKQRTKLKIRRNEVMCHIENSSFPESQPFSWRKVNKEKELLLYDSAIKNRRKGSYHI
jgi:hypothetical protein